MFLKSLINNPAAAFRVATAAIEMDLAAARQAGIAPLFGRSSALPIVDGNPSVTLYETDPVEGSRIRLTHIVGTETRKQYNAVTGRCDDMLSLAQRQGFLLGEIADTQSSSGKAHFVDYGAQTQTIGGVAFTRTAFPVDDTWRTFVNGVQNLDPKEGVLAGQFILRDGSQDGMAMSLRFIDGAAVLSVETLEGTHTIPLHRMAHQENPRFGLTQIFGSEPVYAAAAFAPVPINETITFGQNQTLTDFFGGSFYSGSILSPFDMFENSLIYVLPAKPEEPSAAG